MKRLLAFVVFVVLLTCSASAQTWNEIRSTNLTMVSDASQKQVADALWRFEQARGVFGRLLNRTRVNRNMPMLFIGARTAQEARALGTVTESVNGGLIIFADDRQYFVVDLSSTDWSGLYRSYATILLNANYPRTQPWFDAGIAEYIAGLRFVGNELQLAPTAEVASALSRGAIPIARLISGEVQGGPEFRATSWLFVRWLIDNQRMDDVARYFGLVMTKDVAPEAALKQAFTMTPAEMDAELQSFKAKALQPQRMPPPQPFERDSVVVRKMTEQEAAALRSEIRLESPSLRDQAMAELHQLLAKDPDNVEVHRALGLGTFRAGDMKNAIDYIRRAIQLSDNDPRMRYLEGLWRNHGVRDSIQVDSAAPGLVADMTRAVEIDPQFADAYFVMSVGQMATRHPDHALKSLRQAMALSQRNDSYGLAYANIQLTMGQYDEARSLLDFLEHSPDKQVATKAHETLATARRLRKTEQQLAEQGLYTDPTAPQWKPKKPAEEGTEAADEAHKQEDKPDTRKVEYVKGTLKSVKCSDADKSATVNVMAGKAFWTFKVADRTSVLVIGADNFSCAWENKTVSVNYKSSGQHSGDAVSIEID